MRNPVRKKSYIDVQFNNKLKIGLTGSKVSSDGGLLVIREMDEKLGLTGIAGKYLENNRFSKPHVSHPGKYCGSNPRVLQKVI